VGDDQVESRTVTDEHALTDTRRQRRSLLLAADAQADLRRQAEELLDRLASTAGAASPEPEDIDALVHELRVRQIELELQNEELRQTSEQLEASRARYFALYDLAPVGYLTLGDKSRILRANLAAARALGVPAGELIGRLLTQFIVSDDQDVFYLQRKALLGTGRPQGCELRLLGPAGAPLWMRVDAVRADDGAASSLCHVTLTDITGLKGAEHALRASEERLARAVDGSGVGLWDWHVQSGEESFNERWAEIAGYTLAELAPLSIETWRKLIHPDDLRRAEELLEEHFSGRSPIYSFEERVRHKDGRWVWVLDQGKVSERDSDGRPTRMIGTALDISRRKSVEEEVARALSVLESTLESTADGIMVADGAGGIVRLNARFLEIWGIPDTIAAAGDDEAAIGFVLDQLEAPEAFLQTVRDLYADRERTSFDVLALKDGRVLERYSQPQRIDGSVVGRVWSFRDVTERKRADEEIQQRNTQLLRLIDELLDKTAALEDANATITRIAATDELTDLANRRHFYDALEKAVSLARRHGSPLALLSIDLDGLKRVNDSAGHAAGDEVLATFAALLATSCRAEDLPGRLGGDEFGVLLPGMDLGGACGLAERVLAAVRSCGALAQHGVTVCGGCACWAPGEPPDHFLRRADEALYAATRAGGDAVSSGA
jgi:diguanylate cyclase (GGDEF)-like protein/PAS domain S-box-containing protein